MTLMAWSAELELGLPLIDAQHRVLVDLANALHEGIDAAAHDLLRIRETLESLIDYVHSHFLMEEALCRRLGYPQSELREEEHSGLTDTLAELLARIEGREPVGDAALAFLKDWLVHHICVVDRAHSPLLKAALSGEASRSRSLAG